MWVLDPEGNGVNLAGVRRLFVHELPHKNCAVVAEDMDGNTLELTRQPDKSAARKWISDVLTVANIH